MSADIEEVTAAYLADQRGHIDGDPWVLMNMITSADGAVAIDGRSGGLGNEADFAVFKTLRSLADVILVAAGTIRAEGYGPPNVSADLAEARAARGQAARPIIAVVSRSLRLDLASPLFATSGYRPIVVTVEDAPANALRHVRERADVVVAGTGDVDLAHALPELSTMAGPTILAEGGPTLNAQLAAADLIDELCLTVSPLLVGGDAGRMLAPGSTHEPRRFAIDRACCAGGLLFVRYLRTRGQTAPR